MLTYYLLSLVTTMKGTDSDGISFRYIKYVYDTNFIKRQDVFTVLRYISYNTYGKTMVWDWIRLNWEYLVDRYANDLTEQFMSMGLPLLSLHSHNHWPLLFSGKAKFVSFLSFL